MAQSVNSKLGFNVTLRTFSLNALVREEWGSEFSAPDHGVYRWSNNRTFDSTDLGTTGIYRKPGH